MDCLCEGFLFLFYINLMITGETFHIPLLFFYYSTLYVLKRYPLIHLFNLKFLSEINKSKEWRILIKSYHIRILSVEL